MFMQLSNLHVRDISVIGENHKVLSCCLNEECYGEIVVGAPG